MMLKAMDARHRPGVTPEVRARFLWRPPWRPFPSAASGGGDREPRQMHLRLGGRVLPGGELEQHLLDPLGGKILLRQRHAAVEHL
ncbi:hypothetical protein X566_05705 [Afipia sp. P52-10]|nr:hypothetical protein X566_05705 [Afipia sp. P52-10]